MRNALVLLAILFFAGAASAQQRMLPDDAKPGALKSYQYPEVNISGRWYRLAPGVRMVDQRNMTVLPTMLPNAGPVAFTLDAYGLVTQLWLLTPQEAAALKPVKK
ncbi:MAG TPA: hypothetical protein VF859_04015 [Burkholderiales bacterium]